MDNEKTLKTIVTALAAAQVLHETMDDLALTTFYRQSLKAATNRLETELTKLLDNQITRMYMISEETMRQIQEGITGVAGELATMDPARIAYLGELIKSGALEFKEDYKKDMEETWSDWRETCDEELLK